VLAVSVVAILITVVGAFATDFIGRRTLFLSAALVTWCSLLVVGGMGFIHDPSSSIKQLVVSGRRARRENCFQLTCDDRLPGLLCSRMEDGVNHTGRSWMVVSL
jgi:hypothetical protein